MSAIWTDGEESATTPDLLRLPPERIMVVASMLPAQSAAGLALCCRHLSQALGPRCWKSLRRAPHDDRLDFLSALAKDLPQLYPCHNCLRLHHISAVKWPRDISYSRRPPCIASSGSWTTYRHLYNSLYQIYYPQVQLAMKQHRSGIDIKFPLEAFRYLEVGHGSESPWKVVLYSADAQIVSDEFLMRFQTWTLVPWNRSDTFMEYLERDNLVYSTCIHDYIPRHRDEDTIRNLMITRIGQLEAGENSQPRTLCGCARCYVEYKVDAKDFGERGLAVITTKWINFGAGRETPDDIWQSHGGLYIDGREANQTANNQLGIRKDFEGQAELSVKDPTADNERKLFSTRKSQWVTRASDGCVWLWRYGTRWYLDYSGSPRSIWEIWL
jgi:hypothetical protein